MTERAPQAGNPYDGQFTEIQSPEEIPAFANEEEEAEFWATHSLGEGFRKHLIPPGESQLDQILSAQHKRAG